MSYLTTNQLSQFNENGWLVLSGVLGSEELVALQSEMDQLAGRASPGMEDFSFGTGHEDGSNILRRIEYVIDKSQVARTMMGHPKVLAAVEAIAGPDLFPTQDAMVLKMPAQGIIVPWHRDNASTDDYPSDPPVFIADFYLDDADLDTCLWVRSGSHRWSDEETADATTRFNHDGFSTEEAQPVFLKAGDVLLHNVRLLHGSPPNTSEKLRRVIYYTFHTVHIEWKYGPHTHEYISAKQKILRSCIRERKEMSYATGEESFNYSPPVEFDKGSLEENEKLTTFRYESRIYRSNRYSSKR